MNNEQNKKNYLSPSVEVTSLTVNVILSSLDEINVQGAEWAENLDGWGE